MENRAYDECLLPIMSNYLTLQRQNTPGPVKYNDSRYGADNQIRIIGPGPRDQGAGGDDPQVDHHVVGREYPACLYS